MSSFNKPTVRQKAYLRATQTETDPGMTGRAGHHVNYCPLLFHIVMATGAEAVGSDMQGISESALVTKHDLKNRLGFLCCLYVMARQAQNITTPSLCLLLLMLF